MIVIIINAVYSLYMIPRSDLSDCLDFSVKTLFKYIYLVYSYALSDCLAF